MKCAAETLRDLLWDGGLSQVAKECGHLKDINQFKDIHNILSAFHEGLLREALSEHIKYCSKHSEVSFDAWLELLTSEANCNKPSRFWASMLQYLMAYIAFYIAVRSGNFSLRNACLPKFAELFFCI